MRRSSICDSSSETWSLAVRVVGGAGSALKVPVVAVLKVLAALGEGGDGMLERMVCWISAVPVDSTVLGTGLRLGRRSGTGTGRRRLCDENADDVGSVTDTSFEFGVDIVDGSGGGEGGGECWYVVVLLYVVQENRLVGACLSFSGVSLSA